MKTCFICGGNIEESHLNGAIHSLCCENCGWYRCSEMFTRVAKSDLSISDLQMVAYYMWDINKKNQYSDNDNTFLFLSENYNEIIENILKSPIIPRKIVQKLDKLLLYIYDNCDLGAMYLIKNECLQRVTYSKSIEESIIIINELESNGYISLETKPSVGYRIKLEIKGVFMAEVLKEKVSTSNSVFVAMGFREDLLEAQEVAIKPACEDCGFKAYLISDKQHNEDITDRIIAEIKESRFVIVDFTYNNCGAYFEAGYAQGRGLEVIRTCKNEWFNGLDEKGKQNKLHFDVNHYNFILWDNHEDLKEKLINRIRATVL